MGRRLSIRRRFSLAGASDGWTDECYISYYPASYKEYREYRDIDAEGLTQDNALEMMIGFIKNQFAGGKLLVDMEDGGRDQLVDAEPSDIDLLPPETIGELFLEIVGRATDPKALAEAPQPERAPQNSDLPTAMPSSTDEPTEATS